MMRIIEEFQQLTQRRPRKGKNYPIILLLSELRIEDKGKWHTTIQKFEQWTGGGE